MARVEKSAFALRLRTLRKKHGMTQGDVADRLNMHRTTYTKYETDKTHVDQVYLVALAELFHVTTDYLLGKEGEPVSLLENSNEVTVTPQEAELIALFRRLTPEQQMAMLLNGRQQVAENKADK